MYDEVGPQFAYKLVQEGYTYVDGERENKERKNMKTCWYTPFTGWRLPTWGGGIGIYLLGGGVGSAG